MLKSFPYKKVYFVGIKGVGMTALAIYLKQAGLLVRGSDLPGEYPTTQTLQNNQFIIDKVFEPQVITRHYDAVIYTGAHGGVYNPQVVKAKSLDIPVFNHAQAVSLITQNQQVLAIAGVGGKTTTTAMLAFTLEKLHNFPSYLIGAGSVAGLASPGAFSKKSDYCVVEADEFVADPQADPTPRFLYLNPLVGVITNLAYDHPDVYPDFTATINAFSQFIKNIHPKGLLILNADDSETKKLALISKVKVETVGFSTSADWQIVNSASRQGEQSFSLLYKKIQSPVVNLVLPGKHNLYNASYTLAVLHFLGFSLTKASLCLNSFTGVKRRFEKIASVKTIDLYDDYAHHPIEIEAVINAVRLWFPRRRLIIIFQSHTYSRTKALLSQFAQALARADLVLINNIFASARESDNLGITGKILADTVALKQPNSYFLPDKKTTLDYLKTNLQPNDLIFTLGAGDNFTWHQDIIKVIKKSL